jgi:hypothetical protein
MFNKGSYIAIIIFSYWFKKNINMVIFLVIIQMVYDKL